MTPQQLMDLPYASMAEKQLRKEGKWMKTSLEIAEDSMRTAWNALDNALCKLEYDN